MDKNNKNKCGKVKTWKSFNEVEDWKKIGVKKGINETNTVLFIALLQYTSRLTMKKVESSEKL